MIKSQTAGVLLLISLALMYIPIPVVGNLEWLAKLVVLIVAILLLLRKN